MLPSLWYYYEYSIRPLFVSRAAADQRTLEINGFASYSINRIYGTHTRLNN